MPDLTLNFDRLGGKQLDDFALLARQDYNLGKRNDWFSHFRGGLYGHYSRLTGASIHYGGARLRGGVNGGLTHDVNDHKVGKEPPPDAIA